MLCLTFLQLYECQAVDQVEGRDTIKNGTSFKETRGLFAPRMDYEQWKPLGRGDPLKNDPTYDYVPPVLETVRYWRDTSLRKQDQTPPNQPQKKEVLILGVSSKKPSTGTSIPDNSNRREYFDPFVKYVKEPQYNYQRHRPHNPITSPYFTPSHFLNKLTERPMINNINNDGPVPYTMLVPPPMPSKQATSTYSSYSTAVTKPPSSTGVTIDQANLIFQSSSSVLNDWDSTSVDSSNMVTWKTPVASPEPIMSNIIDGRHEIKPDSFIQIDYSEPINITHTEEELKHEEQISSPNIMHKGQVADGVMDLANTYVNIGKSQAQMDSSSGIGISGISVKPPNFGEMPPMVIKGPGQLMEPMVIPPMFTPKKPALMVETMQTMQTMQPPPRPSYGTLQSLLQKEATKSVSMSTLYVTPTTPTTPSPTTTTTSSLTTDPLFKHYKQPMEPIRGPMYLIIQGHSKVKTYGPSKQIHGISVQEMNEIPRADDAYSVKHLHTFEKTVDDRKRNGRSSNLQTLSHVVQTGLGAIQVADDSADRRNDDFQETVLKVGYKVSPVRKENSSEKYYKGIVETGDLARKLHDSTVS
ncbi:hypothetical protein Trydic_g20957 [Trypoxylus dichotomus]